MSPPQGNEKRPNGSDLPLSEQIVVVLRNRIVTWEIAPDDLLIEARLAEEFNVSRTPVREALAMLSREGFVEGIPRVGYRVTSISIRDVHQIFDLRVLLEGESARLAAQNLSETEVHMLRTAHQEWIETLQFESSVSAEEYLRFHDSFHLGIAELSGNDRLARFVAVLLREGTRVRMSDPLMRTDGLADESRSYMEICDALSAHDAEAASHLMREHILQSKKRILMRLLNGRNRRGIGLIVGS